MEQNLSIDTLIIAKEELREDEATRNNALAQMRLWLKQNKKIIHSRSGCNFYLDQAWFRKLQNLSLSKLYIEGHIDEGKFLNFFFGLPFFDPDEVEDSFVFDIIADMPCNNKIVQICDYLTETYMQDLFPPSLWASKEEVITKYNVCESFHSKFNAYFYHHHPSQYKFIDALQDIQIDKYIKIRSAEKDDSFLLRFLRTKKFSLPLAQEALERYLLLRQTFGRQLGFHQLDITCPKLEELLALGYIFVVPKRDKNGRRIIITRPGVFNPSKWCNIEMTRMHAVTYETLMEDQENQIRGFVHYTDAAGMSLQQLTLYTPREAIRLVKNGEQTLPMRHKEIYGVNVPLSLKFALDFGMSLISEKIKSRVKIFSSINESHAYVDKSLLPKEYGGEMEMSKMIDLWKQELLEKREQILESEKMSVKEDMFSEGARQGRVSALTNHIHHHMVGSFRQLTVD